MKHKNFLLISLALLIGLGTIFAQEKRTYKPLDESVPTNEVIKSKIGKLEFPLGYPTAETAQMLDDEMLYVNAINAYNNTIQGASLMAIRKGFAELGANLG